MFIFVCRSITQDFLSHKKEIKSIIQIDKIICKLDVAINQFSPIDIIDDNEYSPILPLTLLMILLRLSHYEFSKPPKS